MTPRNIVTRQFPSSSSGKIYTVQIDTMTNKTTCDCPGWRFVRNGVRSCKHTKEVEKTFTPVKDEIVIMADGGYIVKEPALPGPRPISKGTVELTPMLASAMPEGKTIKDFCNAAWRIEEKYDGHRLLVKVSSGVAVAKSRPGVSHGANVRDLPQHIQDAFKTFPDGVYDGELYLPGGTSTDVVRLDKQSELVFAIFDILVYGTEVVCGQTYLKRLEILTEVFWISDATDLTAIQLSASNSVTKDFVQSIWDRGGEGAILKHINSTYECGKRSADWIKIKKTDAATVTITGFEKGKLGPNSVAQFQDAAGKTGTIKVLNNELLRLVDANPAKFVGASLVISYMGRTSNGGYRHAVWDHILDK